MENILFSEESRREWELLGRWEWLRLMLRINRCRILRYWEHGWRFLKIQDSREGWLFWSTCDKHGVFGAFCFGFGSVEYRTWRYQSWNTYMHYVENGNHEIQPSDPAHNRFQEWAAWGTAENLRRISISGLYFYVFSMFSLLFQVARQPDWVIGSFQLSFESHEEITSKIKHLIGITARPQAINRSDPTMLYK